MWHSNYYRANAGSTVLVDLAQTVICGLGNSLRIRPFVSASVGAFSDRLHLLYSSKVLAIYGTLNLEITNLELKGSSPL